VLSRSTIKRLKNILGPDGVLTDPETLRVYSYDGQTNFSREPDAVLLPRSADQVARVMRLAFREAIPVTPRGGGTNVSGGSVPIEGGIVLCLTRMDRVISIDRQNLSARVETGIILQDLTVRLAQEGLFFPPDPQSFMGATLGGAIAENAGGPSCLKYGVTKQYILGLDVVLPAGKMISLGGKTLSSSAGYDLLHLFISSEGTLGVVTAAEIRLRPVPPARRTIMAVYDSVEKAGESVAGVFQNAVIPCKIELIDKWLVNTMEDMFHFGLPRDADALLLFEADGTEEEVERDAARIVEIVIRYGAVQVHPAKDADEASRYWLARRAAFAATNGGVPNVLTEDAAVPVTKIVDFIRKCRELEKRYDLVIVVLGHAGDGNLHPTILTDARNKDLWERSLKAMDEIMETALALGGVVSGEHGIGLEKMRFMNRSLGPAVLELNKRIKAMIDPKGIMNPGKIWEK
jgi:glycolate oxidase